MLAEADDAEMRELAGAEVAELEQRLEALEAELKLLLLPKDPNDDQNVILEIRAGTGGDEAALFAAELLPHVHALRRAPAAGRSTITRLSRDRHGRPQGGRSR